MAAAKNLFNDDISILQQVVSFGANVEWKSVQGSVARAEKTFIRPTFGSYYTNLLTKIGDNSLTENDQLLLNELRLAAGNLTWWLYADIHNVNISSVGFEQTNSDTSRNASQWSVEALKKAFRSAGFEAIENTFEFLELNEATYSYNASTIFKDAKALFIDSAATFQEEIDIMRSRYLYMQLIPEMKRIQRDIIKPILGSEAFDTLIKKLQKDNDGDNDLSDDEKIWIPTIKSAVANKTIADSLVKRSVELHEHGLLVHNSAFSGHTTGKEPASRDRILAMQMEFNRLAEFKLNELYDIINPPAEEETTENTNHLDPEDSLGFF